MKRGYIIYNLSSILIGLCVVLFLVLAFKKQVGFILSFSIKAISGGFAFSLINAIFAHTVVGINLLSIITVGFLGLPGFILLLATKIFI